MQSDINGRSGFNKMSETFNDKESASHGIHCFDFTKDDIVRSEILKFIVDKIQVAQTEENKSQNQKSRTSRRKS